MVLSRDPEKAAGKAAAKAEREQQRSEAEWWNSPPGQARAARFHGRTILQLAIPLERRARTGLGVFSGDATKGGFHIETQDASGTIEQVEAEGWMLENVGYVFRETGSVSRDKLLSSGQTAQVVGDIVGIYIFRLDPDWTDGNGQRPERAD